MTHTIPAQEVDTGSYKLLKWSVYLAPILLGVLLMPFALIGIYFDSKTIREYDFDWQPDATLIILFGALVSPPLAVLHYLHRRTTHVLERNVSENWRYLIYASLTGFALYVLSPVVAGALGISLGPVPLVLALVLNMGLPVALYRDPFYIRENYPDADWTPNSGTFTTLGIMSFLPFIGWVTSGYYLYRRYSLTGHL